MDVFFVQARFGGDFEAQAEPEGVSFGIDCGQDSSGYLMLTWASVAALKKWLEEAVESQTGVNIGPWR